MSGAKLAGFIMGRQKLHVSERKEAEERSRGEGERDRVPRGIPEPTWYQVFSSCLVPSLLLLSGFGFWSTLTGAEQALDKAGPAKISMHPAGWLVSWLVTGSSGV